MSTQCILLLVRSFKDPTFCGIFVCGPLQFKCPFFNSFRIHIFPFRSHSFGIETINTFIHVHSRSFIETIPDSRSKWAKCFLPSPYFISSPQSVFRSPQSAVHSPQSLFLLTVKQTGIGVVRKRENPLN